MGIAALSEYRDTLERGMKERLSLSGLGTALVTPFHPDGPLDLTALRSLVAWQIERGVNFLVPCGSTGEAATLNEDETTKVVEAVVEAAAGRVPVIAGCTHNSTSEAVRRAKLLAQVPGLGGILTANPYYSKPSQRGQLLHFTAIAEAVQKPVLLYNIPGRTAANLEPSTVLQLAKVPNIIGIKESSGNLAQISELLAQAPEDFHVFAGDDYLALPVLAAGGAGLVSVVSNITPREIVQMLAAASSGDWHTARQLAKKVAALTNALFSEPNPAPTKAALRAMGKIASDALRLPMVPVADETRQHLQVLMRGLAL